MHFLFFLVFVLAAKLNKADTSNCLGCGAKKKKTQNKWKQMKGEREKKTHSFSNHTTHFHVIFNGVKSERRSIISRVPDRRAAGGPPAWSLLPIMRRNDCCTLVDEIELSYS